MPPTKHRRRYHLTAQGRQRLRESIQRTRPWEQSTGPRTSQGKVASSQNALKHGMRTAATQNANREFNQALRSLNLQLQVIEALHGTDDLFEAMEALLSIDTP